MSHRLELSPRSLKSRSVLLPLLLATFMAFPAFAQQGNSNNSSGGDPAGAQSSGSADTDSDTDPGAAGGNGNSPAGTNPSGTEGNQGNGVALRGNAGGSKGPETCTGAGCGEPPACTGAGCGPGNPQLGLTAVDDSNNLKRCFLKSDEPESVYEEFVCPPEMVQ